MEGAACCIVMGKNCRAVDLSYPLNSSTIYWPGGEGFTLCMNTCHVAEFDYDYAAGTISCAEHGGTHVDAPFHFKADGATVDAIPLEQLIGNCKVIDVTSPCASNPDYAVTVDDILTFEQTYGGIQNGDIVLFKTSWSSKYAEGPLAYLGFDERVHGPYNAESVLQFPALSEAAARLLVDRKVAAVGLDTASLDPGFSKDFIVHRVLLGNGIFGIENVNGNIGSLPAVGSTLMVMPLKITGGSGSPARVVAFFEDQA